MSDKKYVLGIYLISDGIVTDEFHAGEDIVDGMYRDGSPHYQQYGNISQILIYDGPM